MTIWKILKNNFFFERLSCPLRFHASKDLPIRHPVYVEDPRFLGILVEPLVLFAKEVVKGYHISWKVVGVAVVEVGVMGTFLKVLIGIQVGEVVLHVLVLAHHQRPL